MNYFNFCLELSSAKTSFPRIYVCGSQLGAPTAVGGFLFRIMLINLWKMASSFESLCCHLHCFFWMSKRILIYIGMCYHLDSTINVVYSCPESLSSVNVGQCRNKLESSFEQYLGNESSWDKSNLIQFEPQKT